MPHGQRAIVDGVIDDTKTHCSKASLPLDGQLAEVLKQHRRNSKFNKDEDFVFASWRTLGRLPLRGTAVLENYIKPAASRAGLGVIGWHTFRRTFSTLLRANGVDIKVQQELMRHRDIRTTMNLYTQADSDQTREAQRGIVQGVLAAPCSPVLPQESVSA